MKAYSEEESRGSLEVQGYKVYTAYTGSEALDIINNEKNWLYNTRPYASRHWCMSAIVKIRGKYDALFWCLQKI